jgi:hypothetical protein
MKRATLVALLSLVLSLWPIAAIQAGPITYDLNNYSSLQNGWTLSGSITTDGAIGDIGAAAIISWHYTISKGVTSFSASSESGGYAQVTHVTATPTELLLYAPNGFTYNQLWLIGSYTDPLASFLLYDRDNTGEAPEQDFYRQYDRPGYSWSSYSQDSSILPLGGNPWVMATVPEPASITLLLAGVGALAGYRLTRSSWRGA